MNCGGGRHPGFTLVEVVIAVGVLAVVFVALLGVGGPAARRAGEIADRHTVARLGAAIQGELGRLQAELGLDGLALAVPAAGSDAPLRLVAARDGSRVRLADGPAPAADRALDDPELPGLARRDRYFLIEVTRQLDLPYASGAGFLAVSIRVSWPYLLPAGPATPGETRVDGDPAREVPAGEREWAIANLAFRS